MEELGAAAAEAKVDDLLRQILERTGYASMLQADNDPEAESRLGNLNELVNAASEAAERGETIAEFLDHAALVSDTDDLDERAPGLAAHAAQRQRPGVSHRVPGRNGRGAFPAHSLAGFQSRHGRRAASVLRRHDALREAAVPDVGALSPALWRRPAGSYHPLAIPARSSPGAGRRPWPVAPTLASRRWISLPSNTKCAKPPSAISTPARPTTPSTTSSSFSRSAAKHLAPHQPRRQSPIRQPLIPKPQPQIPQARPAGRAPRLPRRRHDPPSQIRPRNGAASRRRWRGC